MLEKFVGKVVKDIKVYREKYSTDASVVVVEFEDGEFFEIKYDCTYADSVWLVYDDKLTDDYSDRERYILDSTGRKINIEYMEIHQKVIEKMQDQSKLLLEGRYEEARRLNTEIQELNKMMDEAIIRNTKE